MGEQVEVVRADPALRRRVLLCTLAVVVLGALAIARAPATMHGIFHIARESPAEAERRARLLVASVLGPMTLGGVAVGLATIRMALRALAIRRFPPPGAKVLRDTPVVRGEPARVVAAIVLVLGTMLAGASGALAWYGYRLAAALGTGCPRAARPR